MKNAKKGRPVRVAFETANSSAESLLGLGVTEVAVGVVVVIVHKFSCPMRSQHD
jgi:hypothetical protein